MRYEAIPWWPGAFHVYKKKGKKMERVGIVNSHTLKEGGRTRGVWYAHNKHFFSIGSEYPTRAAASSVLDTSAIHHNSNAFK
jgi:hypothetical protein